MSRRHVWLIVVIGALLLLPSAAWGDGLEDLWVGGTSNQDEDVNGWDEVHWWYASSEKTYYLFLPACADANQLTIHFTGASSIKLDGKEVQNGEAVALTPGEKMTVKNGNKDYKVQVMQSEGVPALFIRTQSGELGFIHKNKANKEPGTMLMVYADGQIAYQGNLTQVKGRGNATFYLDKRPYQIKLEDKTDLCGLGEDKTWILLANFRDNSLLRNKLAFEMARASGLQYTPSSAFCDVYMNNKYYGTYELCTKVEIGEGRVDIFDLEKATEAVNDDPLESYDRFGKESFQKGKSKGVNIPKNPTDITGGYVVELDYRNRFENEVSGYTTEKGQSIVVKYPEYASKEQMTYISEILQSFENAIRADDGFDPDTGKHFSEIMDMESFVRKYLLEEIVKNYDGNRSSQFYYKEPDSISDLLYAGPAWDYDSSIGNYAGKRKVAPADKFGVCNDAGTSYYWFPAAYEQEEFRWKVQGIYVDVYLPILETLLGIGEGGADILSIDEYAAEVEASAAMNFKRWPMFNHPARAIKTGADYGENIEYIKTFFKNRMVLFQKEWVIPYQKGHTADRE